LPENLSDLMVPELITCDPKYDTLCYPLLITNPLISASVAIMISLLIMLQRYKWSEPDLKLRW